jgi:2',3'-cyclic-nucleotide 2'-phosphodiesterase (5'-nucleotidase family)
VAAFEFIDYEQALREVVPDVRAADADLVIVAGHLCSSELVPLAQQVADLEIALIGGGHCNELFAEEVAGTILIEGGYHFTSYATASLTVDTATDEVLSASYGTVADFADAPADPSVVAVVDKWQEQAEDELEVVIGYLEQPLHRRSDSLEQLVTETWLKAYPTADVALTNRGGFRAGLPAGEVTFADVVGVLPFNNVLVEVELGGQELLQVLAHGSAAVGGAELGVGDWILEASGEAIDPAGRYRLLVNDFMYAGGDGYEMLARYDPDAYNTAIDWRQPVIDWILAQHSSLAAPLDPALEQLAE